MRRFGSPCKSYEYYNETEDVISIVFKPAGFLLQFAIHPLHHNILLCVQLSKNSAFEKGPAKSKMRGPLNLWKIKYIVWAIKVACFLTIKLECIKNSWLHMMQYYKDLLQQINVSKLKFTNCCKNCCKIQSPKPKFKNSCWVVHTPLAPVTTPRNLSNLGHLRSKLLST